MCKLSPEQKLEMLVGLMKHLNELLHKWITPYIAIQSGLIVAVATLIKWDRTGSWLFNFVLILGLGLFAIVISQTMKNILVRNRNWFKHYVEEAIKAEGGDGIWRDNFNVGGKPLSENIGFLNKCIIIGWISFLVLYVLARVCPIVSPYIAGAGSNGA